MQLKLNVNAFRQCLVRVSVRVRTSSFSFSEGQAVRCDKEAHHVAPVSEKTTRSDKALIDLSGGAPCLSRGRHAAFFTFCALITYEVTATVRHAFSSSPTSLMSRRGRAVGNNVLFTLSDGASCLSRTVDLLTTLRAASALFENSLIRCPALSKSK